MHMHAREIAQIAGDVNCVVDCTFHWILVGLLNFQSLFLHIANSVYCLKDTL